MESYGIELVSGSIFEAGQGTFFIYYSKICKLINVFETVIKTVIKAVIETVIKAFA